MSTSVPQRRRPSSDFEPPSEAQLKLYRRKRDFVIILAVFLGLVVLFESADDVTERDELPPSGTPCVDQAPVRSA